MTEEPRDELTPAQRARVEQLAAQIRDIEVLFPEPRPAVIAKALGEARRNTMEEADGDATADPMATCEPAGAGGVRGDDGA